MTFQLLFVFWGFFPIYYMISIIFKTLRGYHSTCSVIPLPPHPKSTQNKNFETCTLFGNISSSKVMHKTGIMWLLKGHTLASSRETILQRGAVSCLKKTKVPCFFLSAYHTATHMTQAFCAGRKSNRASVPVHPPKEHSSPFRLKIKKKVSFYPTAQKSII